MFRKLLISACIVFILWAIRKLVLKFYVEKMEDAFSRYHWKKVSAYITFFLVVLMAGPIWFSGIKNATTYLGLLSAGVAIALQGPIVNLAGWLFILWRRPFRVGDRIQIGDHAGDVMDLRLFQFLLMEIGNWVDADQSTGRVIHIPNGKVFSEVLANYSRGFQYLWNEIPVLITFESNWKKAKDLLTEISVQHGANVREHAKKKVKEASTRFLIYYSKLTPIVYTTVKDSGVMLTIRYLCKPKQRRGTSQAIWENILDEFAKHPDIDLAYPTQRFYTHPRLKNIPGDETGQD